MDELIYQFLLQAGYPRAAIVVDATLLARNGAVPEHATSFVIVDPDNALRLAVIDVVDAIDADSLREVARTAGSYADSMGGKAVQGFVVRVDARGKRDTEQVQFYRVWPNALMQQLSAKTFPDLDALRVARMLVLEGAAAATFAPEQEEKAAPALSHPGGSPSIAASLGSHDIVDEIDRQQPEQPSSGGVARVLPSLILILLFVTDWYLLQVRGVPLLSLPQTLLAVGAAAMITAGGLFRQRY